jgi:probable HAF family extracellular repeat protein
MAKTWFGVSLAVAAILGTACSRSPVAPNPGATPGVGSDPGSQPDGPGEIPGYAAIDLGTLGGDRTLPSAINDDGTVVGSSETTDRRLVGFVYNGAMHVLRPSQNVYFEGADAINAAGQIGGVVHDARTILRWSYGIAGAPDLQVFPAPAAPAPPPSRVVAINAVGDMLVRLDDNVHAAGGVVLHDGGLQDLGGLVAGYGTYPLAWNESGQVVGTSFVRHIPPTYDIFHPFIWNRGVMEDLGVLGELTCGDTQTDCAGGYAVDINAQGTVVGTVTGAAAGLDRAFIWQNGVMHDLGVFEGHSTSAVAINDRGQVLFVVGAPNLGVFVWDNGGVQRVGPIGLSVWGRALGENGEVVGELQRSDGVVHGFVWNAGVLTDLGPGSATAINAQGDVIGTDGLRGMLWRRLKA